MIEEAVLIGLAAWRMTALLTYERGPFDVFMRFRQLLGFDHDEKGEPTEWPGNTLARAFSCPWCLGLYMAVVAWAFWEYVNSTVVLVIAASAVLVVVERWNRS